jgi:hypothetical protein
MRRRSHSAVLVGLLLLLGLAMVVVGCFGGEDEAATNAQSLEVRSQSQTTTLSTVNLAMTVSPADAYSTFRSKDPFIQQALPPSTTGTTAGEPAPTSTVSSTTTTSAPPPSTTSTTSPSTTTTAFFLHLLQVLWAGTLDDAPAVTFQVDNNVYQNARIGDVISTSWGQIKVVDIEVETQIVTLLQGSETLVLLVGQVVFE